MFEKIVHEASELDVEMDEIAEQRRVIAHRMVTLVGDEEIKGDLRRVTKVHLSCIFSDDIYALETAVKMLCKFGQSVGTLEKEGYLFGSELYLQAILVVMLVVTDDVFSKITNALLNFLGKLPMDKRMRKSSLMLIDGDDSTELDEQVSKEGLCIEDAFEIDDLTISFSAFSGLLTFYRDSPIGANKTQETFLANMFVAVTREANEPVHLLRTKCVLSHLYLKHGDVDKALEECEGIKSMYDHDSQSVELATQYGMDWALICICTMASTYLFRGKLAHAQDNIDFLLMQMTKLDEFKSSTKAMSKGNVASYYFRLGEYEKAAAIANGIIATDYGYFFKSLGRLQEELANRNLALYVKREFYTGADDDADLLSVLSTDLVNSINRKRPMLDQVSSTLSSLLPADAL